MSEELVAHLKDAVFNLLEAGFDEDVIYGHVIQTMRHYNGYDDPEDDACSEEAIEKRNDAWARSQVTPEEEERENFLMDEFERQLRQVPDADVRFHFNDGEDQNSSERRDLNQADVGDDIPF